MLLWLGWGLATGWGLTTEWLLGWVSLVACPDRDTSPGLIGVWKSTMCLQCAFVHQLPSHPWWFPFSTSIHLVWNIFLKILKELALGNNDSFSSISFGVSEELFPCMFSRNLLIWGFLLAQWSVQGHFTLPRSCFCINGKVYFITCPDFNLLTCH